VARQNLTGLEVEVVRARSNSGGRRTRSAWCTRPPPGTGSTPPSATSAPGRRCGPAVTSPSGRRAHLSDGGDPFFEELQDIYDEIGEGLPPGTPRTRPGELADERAGIEASGLFEVTAVRQYGWERLYQAEEYIELLETFSGHLDMAGVETPPAVRRDPAAAGAAPRSCGAAGLGRGAARRAQAGLSGLSRTAGPGGGIPGWRRCPWSCPAGAAWPAGSRGREGARSVPTAWYSSGAMISSSRRVPEGIASMGGEDAPLG